MAERAKLALFIAICLMAVGQLLPVHTTFVWLWTAEAVANWLDYLGVDPHLAEMVGLGISAPIMLFSSGIPSMTISGPDSFQIISS